MIFINYRRIDTGGYAGRLFDRLKEKYGNSNVFYDIEGNEPGSHIREKLDQAIDNTLVMLVFIGRQWLIRKGRKRRLDEENDWVRLEIEAALDHKIRVIPILLNGAKLPNIKKLPGKLVALAGLQTCEIRDDRFALDVEYLMKTLNRFVPARNLGRRSRNRSTKTAKESLITPGHKKVTTRTEEIDRLRNLFDGICEDLKDPFQKINELVAAIEKEEDISKIRLYVANISHHAKRPFLLLNELNNFLKRPLKQVYELVQVDTILSEVINVAKISFEDSLLKIQSNISPLPPIKANSATIAQAFLNIFLNGIQALKGKGVLEVNAGLVGNEIMVSISDTGSGIPQENLKKIFDPFFSTKPVGKGGGLGLTVSKGIIEDLGGRISMESKVGRGTTCLIKLPLPNKNVGFS